MSFKERIQEELQGKVSDELLEKIPKGFQRIGDVIVINLLEELIEFEEDIGQGILKIFPGIKSVLAKTGSIQGEFRQPSVKVIAGEKNPEVCHLESGVWYCFNPLRLMFAKGNVSERTRVAKEVKSEEVIVDMFGGIGYFTLPLAKIGKPKKIYSIELNPEAFKYLEKNIKKNKVDKIVEAISGDSREIVEKLVKENGRIADRVMMGYLPAPKEFLPSAMKIVKKGGLIYYEDVISIDKKEEEIRGIMKLISEAAEVEGMKAELKLAKKIKSYGPRVDHYVFDVRIF